jgi:hypothetical protein
LIAAGEHGRDGRQQLVGQAPVHQLPDQAGPGLGEDVGVSAGALFRLAKSAASSRVIGRTLWIECGSEQVGHGSPAGHRSGPPTELCRDVGVPGRG